jgi:hypothetical protein
MATSTDAAPQRAEDARAAPPPALPSPLSDAALAQSLGSGAFDGLLELDISNSDITVLPPAIGRLARLVKLNAGGCALSDLPAEIAQCRALEIAFFLGNHFRDIPRVLGSLPALRMLSFKSCRLAGAVDPEALAPSLQWLILSANALTAPPTEGAGDRLARVRKFMLAGNRLERAPDLTALPAVELLRVADNALPRSERAALAAAAASHASLAWLALGAPPPLEGTGDEGSSGGDAFGVRGGAARRLAWRD